SASSASEYFHHFQIEAVDSAVGEFHGQFNKPVRLILTFDEAEYDLSRLGKEPFLAYRDEEDPTRWHHVDIEIHEEINAISADVLHFSEWVSGDRPSGWKMTWSPPVVSEFSGAATYSYPINVPPGRAGLQPQVGLSYNSRNVDGHVLDADPGFIANGWSMAEMGVFRTNTEIRLVPGDPKPNTFMIHPDEYSLVLNGVGYDLTIGPGENAGNVTARYYAKDNPQLYIERRYDNTKKTHWVVKDGSGRTYTMGDRTDAETWQCLRYTINLDNAGINRGTMAGCPEESTYGIGSDEHQFHQQSPIGWYVTKIEDEFDNIISYHYQNKYTTRVGENPNADDYVFTRKARISDIYYNYKNNSYNGSTPTNNAGTHVAFRPASASQIKSVYVYHGNVGSSNPTGEYRLTTSTDTIASSHCKKVDRPGYPAETTTFTMLDKITLHTQVDNDPSTTNVGYFLPSTEFDYETLPHYYHNWHFNDASKACFSYPYLKSYENGYGGKVSFEYQHDTRQSGKYFVDTDKGFNFIEYPKIGLSYYVAEQTVNDGFGDVSRTSYEYENPCYTQDSRDNLAHLGAADTQICHSAPYGRDTKHPDYAPLTGFEKTVATTIDLLVEPEEAIGRSVYSFYAAPPIADRSDLAFEPYELMLGKSKSVRVGFPQGESWLATNYPRTTTITTYTTVGGSAEVARVNQTQSYDEVSMQTITHYGYNDFAMVTSIKEEADGEIFRTTLRDYNINGSRWLIGRVNRERVFEGAKNNIDNTSGLLHETRYTYADEFTVPETIQVGHPAYA
ncbi:MAG: hypothetical protein AAGD96_31115, partial [Chloroflexota bacterium]